MKVGSAKYRDKLEALKKIYHDQDLWVLVNPKSMSTPRWRSLEGLAGDPEAEEYVNSLYAQVQSRMPEALKTREKDHQEETERLKYEGQGVAIDSYDPPPLEALRGKKVWLYHGTSTSFDEAIKKNGLVPGKAGSNYGWRKDYIFLTARSHGSHSSAQFYAKQAVAKHGGDSVIYRVLVEGNQLEPDPDDADIYAGRFQYIVRKVRPAQIKERLKVGTMQRSAVLTSCFRDINSLYLDVRDVIKKKPSVLQGPDYDQAMLWAVEMERLSNQLVSKVGYALRQQAEAYRDFAQQVIFGIDHGDLKSLTKLTVKVNPEIRRYYNLPDESSGESDEFSKFGRLVQRVVSRHLQESEGQRK